MRKGLLIAFVFGLGLLLISGCNTAQTAAPTEVIDGPSLASSIGGLVVTSTQVDGTASGLMGISGVGSSGIKALAASNLEYVAPWWTFTWEASTMSYNFKVKAYTSGGTAITNVSDLATLTNKIELALSMTIGTALNYSFGSEANPLVFDGLQTGTKSITGPISLTLTDSDDNTYTVSITYAGVELDASGYPTSGTVTFSFSSTDYVAVAGTVTFNGATATLVYTSPASLAVGTYTINMATGAVTISSL